MRESLALMRRAVEVAENARDNDVWCPCATQLGIYLVQAGRLREAHAIVAKVAPRVSAVQFPLEAFGTYWSGGGIFSDVCDFQTAKIWWERGLNDRKLARYQHDTMAILVGVAACWTGDLALASRLLSETLITHGNLLFMEGHWERARAWFEDSQRKEINFPEHSLAESRDLARVLRALGQSALGSITLEELLARFPLDEPHLQIEMGTRPELALLYLELGKLDSAAKQIARCNEIVSTGEDWRVMAGHHVRASAVYLATVGQYEPAEHLFASAAGTFSQFSSVWDEAATLHYWGRALVSAGENKRAIEKLEGAVDIYRRHGAGKRWVDHVMATMPHRPSPQTYLTREAVSKASPCTFRREGDFWTISHRERTFRLRDMKGLQYIAHLLAHPGEQFHVHDLVTAIDGCAKTGQTFSQDFDLRVATGLGDAGAMLDPRAKAEYRSRRRELLAELDEAEEANDGGRIERIRAEVEVLESELSAAVGLGGRDRKAADQTERIRNRIGKAIRGSLLSIRENDPSLGHHLTTCIRTGFLCTYNPDPEGPVSWQL